MKKLLLISALFVFAACTEFEEATQTNIPVAFAPQTRSGGSIPTFDTLPNPFALDVMQTIYDTYDGNTTLQPTDLYVRIMPQDSLQAEWLLYESGLELFDYPLDLEIEEGQEYIDPTIPEGEPGWLYTTVKPDYVFPSGYVYEVLEDCYIPAEGETISPRYGTRAGEDVDVLRAALEMLGYELEPERPQTRGSSANPHGRVTVMDNSVTPAVPIPVKGVKVRCHFVIYWRSAYTNENGEYYISGMKVACKVHYAIVYHNNKDFKIWGDTGCLSPVIHNMGWHYTENAYNPNIGTGSNAWKWSVVNNAAYDYYKMCEQTGISKPPTELKIDVDKNGENNAAPMLRRVSAARILTKDNWASYLGWATGWATGAIAIDFLFKWTMPDLYIGLKNHNTYRAIYEVVNHELSHASHFSQVGRDYWARYISHIVSKLGYGSDGSGTNAGVCEVGEMWANAIEEIQGCEAYNDMNRLGRTYADNSFWSSWIQPAPLWALITRGVLTKRQVFDCLTSDVDTQHELLLKLCLTYRDKAPLISMAFENNDVMGMPVITGPDKPSLNTNVTYRFETILPTGYSFDRWAVIGQSGGTYQRQGSWTDRDLIIKFTSASQFSIIAEFDLPGGSYYTITKRIDLRPETPLIPVVAHYAPPVISSGEVAFYVTNTQYGATYEWYRNGAPFPGSTSNVAVMSTYGLPPYSDRLSARCRTHLNGMISDWSNISYVLISPSGPMNAPSTTDSLTVANIMSQDASLKFKE